MTTKPQNEESLDHSGAHGAEPSGSPGGVPRIRTHTERLDRGVHRYYGSAPGAAVRGG